MPQIRSAKSNSIQMKLIAPCGMNCRLCVAYTREKNPCAGCRNIDKTDQKTRVFCPIRTCAKRKQRKARFCIGCDSFPCDRLRHLDKRYRTKYGMSMLDNLAQIKKTGIRLFIKNELKKWACSECGGLLCVHKPQCLSCGRRWRQGASLC